MREPDSISDYLDKDEYKLYKLIWTRFVASQMPPAVFDETVVDIKAGRYDLRARGFGDEVPWISRPIRRRQGRGSPQEGRRSR